ncbi:lipase member H-A-like [Fopius arisanus]|uniref:phospholipase A1 n=1 Tax=Fopius arisanus TaxID=64838 RepID=A0A0C9QC05_9HYME|nr:PREDICTED: lipase member H-A-like [Fopius arisanus]
MVIVGLSLLAGLARVKFITLKRTVRETMGLRPGCSRHLLRLTLLMMMCLLSMGVFGVALSKSVSYQTHRSNKISRQFGISHRDYFLGPCLVHTNQTCPDDEVTFFLYTRDNPGSGKQIFVNDSSSNLHETNFNPRDPTKIVVHGYNSDMRLDSLVDIRNEYLKKRSYNVIAVDWHRLAVAPCYPIAVHNVPHVGDCLAQLIERLKDVGAIDIHTIGFSLGAHVPAFAANALRPYKIPRITGLDPAMPLFITVSKDEKLDSGDGDFVDVFHTNAFIQGKVETSGHIDFYINGGINQPGCWGNRNPFGCNHHRAAVYFAESINSEVGFWGWPCPGFLAYLLALCPPRAPAVLAGDPVDENYRGFFLVHTRDHSPFAEGPFTISTDKTSR